MLHLLARVWVLRRYKAPPPGKLYSEPLRTPRRLHCFHLADSRTLLLWGVRSDRRALRYQSIPSGGHEAVFCFMLRCLLPLPFIITLPKRPITGSCAAHATARKHRRQWQDCMCADLMCVPELTSIPNSGSILHNCIEEAWRAGGNDMLRELQNKKIK